MRSIDSKLMKMEARAYVCKMVVEFSERLVWRIEEDVVWPRLPVPWQSSLDCILPKVFLSMISGLARKQDCFQW